MGHGERGKSVITPTLEALDRWGRSRDPGGSLLRRESAYEDWEVCGRGRSAERKQQGKVGRKEDNRSPIF